MALFKSSNPALQEKAFKDTVLEGLSTGQEMTMNGTMNKLGILFLLMPIFALLGQLTLLKPNLRVLLATIWVIIL